MNYTNTPTDELRARHDAIVSGDAYRGSESLAVAIDALCEGREIRRELQARADTVTCPECHTTTDGYEDADGKTRCANCHEVQP